MPTLWPQHWMIALFEGVTSQKDWEQLFQATDLEKKK